MAPEEIMKQQQQGFIAPAEDVFGGMVGGI
jgi:hypothetical protein